jgi:ATP-dependent DNA helicase RecQ
MSFMGRLAGAEKALPTAAQPMPKPGGGPQPDEGLFEALRARRKEIAVSEHVPPYVIFHDRTLYEMAAYRPQSLESLGRMSGVGARKLSKYGEAMLAVIQAYCKEHGLVEIREAKHLEGLRKVKKGEVKKDAKGKDRKFILAGEGFRGGATLDELADRFGVQHTIVVNYLAQYIKAGYSLPQERLLELVLASPERQKRVFELFDELGTRYLKPVYDASGGEVDNDDLKILWVIYINGGHAVKKET